MQHARAHDQPPLTYYHSHHISQIEILRTNWNTIYTGNTNMARNSDFFGVAISFYFLLLLSSVSDAQGKVVYIVQYCSV